MYKCCTHSTLSQHIKLRSSLNMKAPSDETQAAAFQSAAVLDQSVVAQLVPILKEIDQVVLIALNVLRH